MLLMVTEFKLYCNDVSLFSFKRQNNGKIPTQSKPEFSDDSARGRSCDVRLVKCCVHMRTVVQRSFL